MKTKEQFVTETLIGYIRDPKTCAVGEYGNCQYLTADGYKCAVGKHCLNPAGLLNIDVVGLLNKFSEEELFTPEAVSQKLTPLQWLRVQLFHDRLANYGASDCLTEQALKLLQETFNCEFKDLQTALNEAKSKINQN